MFHLRRPDARCVDSALEAASRTREACPRLLSLNHGLALSELPSGYAHDHLRSRLGEGPSAFAAARRAFANWAEFDLGSVRVVNFQSAVAPGQIVAVEIHALGLWSLNLSRILETVDARDRFGFLYATTAHHAEQGEERFLLEYDPRDGGVWYHLEAVSRPRHPLPWAAYPVTRALQHRFARHSHQRMRRAVVEAFQQP